MLANAPISFNGELQRPTAQSTMEAELVAEAMNKGSGVLLQHDVGAVIR